MDLTVSEFVDILRKWETEGIKISGLLESTQSSIMQVQFTECAISVKGASITVTGDRFQVSATLVPTMTFKYSESEGDEPHNSILEVRALAWRCILFEPTN